MKILQIVNPVMPFPPTTIGGTERIVKYLCDELLERNHEVTLLCHNSSQGLNGLKTIGIGTYDDQKNTIKKVWQHLISNRYDVIHNHGRLIYCLPRIWSTVRKIHTFHMADLESHSFNRFLQLKPRNLTLSPCAKWIQLAHKHVTADWQYVNNGIPLHLYQCNPNLANLDRYLVIIARMSPGKGITDAISISEKSGMPLVIAGKIGDYPHEKEWFETHVRAKCDGVRIRFAGEVDDAQKQKLLENAAALLMLSTDSEAFNLTMLEANACGCPVITYERYFSPDFILQGVNGFMGKNQQELIAATAQIASIDRKRCRKYFEEAFTAAVMTDKYMELYQSTV